jgi:hypothetical protein
VPAGRARRGASGARRGLARDECQPAHHRAGPREGPRPGPGNAGAGVRCPGGGAHVRAAPAGDALRPGRAAAGHPGHLPAPLVGYRSAGLAAQRRGIGPNRNRRRAARHAAWTDRSDRRTAPGHYGAGACPRTRDRPHPLLRRREEAGASASRCQAHPHPHLRRAVGDPCPADRRDRRFPRPRVGRRRTGKPGAAARGGVTWPDRGPEPCGIA